MRAELERLSESQLSANTREIVDAGLGDAARAA